MLVAISLREVLSKRHDLKYMSILENIYIYLHIVDIFQKLIVHPTFWGLLIASAEFPFIMESIDVALNHGKDKNDLFIDSNRKQFH